jgi:hypothetical protein
MYPRGQLKLWSQVGTAYLTSAGFILTVVDRWPDGLTVIGLHVRLQLVPGDGSR